MREKKRQEKEKEKINEDLEQKIKEFQEIIGETTMDQSKIAEIVGKTYQKYPFLYKEIQNEISKEQDGQSNEKWRAE